MLLLGIGTALLPMSGSTIQAASVRIDDRARVLDVAQVRDAASKLSQPVYVSTISTFDGSKSEFIQSVQRTITDQKMIAIGISVEQRYLAIVAGSIVGVERIFAVGNTRRAAGGGERIERRI